MVTVDGYFAGLNGEIDWFVWSEEMAKYAIALVITVDTILFGRVTYELMEVTGHPLPRLGKTHSLLKR